MLGYEVASSVLAEVGKRTPDEIVAYLDGIAQRWAQGSSRLDDMTFVVLQARPLAEPPARGHRTGSKVHAVSLAAPSVN